MEEKPITEELKRRAYAQGLQLKNSGLDAETIYARLERAGIPEELARRVANDLMLERKKQQREQAEPFYKLALIRIGLGTFLAVASYVAFPGVVILPVGLIVGGILSAVSLKEKHGL